MTYFIQKITHCSLLAVCAMVAPISASAESATPYIVISSNTPEKVAAIEPVLIDRSGLAVAPVDLQATGGLTPEAALLTVTSSKRPVTRSDAAQVVLASSKPPLPIGTHRIVNTTNTTVSTRTGPLRPAVSSLSRQGARAENRQLPNTGRDTVQRSAISAAPSYLLGVFR